MNYCLELAILKGRMSQLKNPAQRKTLSEVVVESFDNSAKLRKLSQDGLAYINSRYPELYQFVDECKKHLKE